MGKDANPDAIPERRIQRLVALHREEMRQLTRTGDRYLRPVLAVVLRNFRSPAMESVESQKDGLVKAKPRIGQAYPGPGALEQPGRELAFQARNEAAECRLRGAELPRRMGEAASAAVRKTNDWSAILPSLLAAWESFGL